MILNKSFFIKKTPLNIPLILFLISQTVSTIFSLDSHVSFFGYYSRFNGGLLSTISYILLYYAFVTYFDSKKTLKLLKIIIISGLFVVLWGLPSHFGYDPTCYIFRRELNVSCWTEAFKPTIRIFSTLGQPAWLAAYISVLLPISISLFILIITQQFSQRINNIRQIANGKKILAISYLLLTTLLYISLLYTGTRAGFLGFWIANIFFWIIIFIKRFFALKQFLFLFIIFNFLFLTFNFFITTPISQLNKFTYNAIYSSGEKFKTTDPKSSNQANPDNNSITDSADIRRIVWQGAVEAWKAYPIFGSGVETFAFSYYRYRPVEHNLTSEWDYLYNKAHNEYLNYLATTGIVGLGTYIFIIGTFCFLILKQLLKENETGTLSLLTIALFTGWVSILVTNFFGFSVVIINLFFFLIPGFVFILHDKLDKNSVVIFPKIKDSHALKLSNSQIHISISQWIGVIFLLLTTLYLILILFRHWQADQSYNLGLNLSRSNYPQEGFNALTNAVSIRPSEPVFQDELSMSTLQISLILFQQNEATTASQLAQSAIDLNTNLLIKHPNYLPFWKSRIRLFYTLGELVSDYKKEALTAAKQAARLAPTDAKIWYNLGVLYGQTGQENEGIKTLNKTIIMKPDYQDAYLALGLLYHQIATDEKGMLTDTDMQNKAIGVMNKLLEINPKHEQAKQSLSDWKSGKLN